MRIRLLTNCRADKILARVLAEIRIIAVVLDKANEASLIIRSYYCNKILVDNG